MAFRVATVNWFGRGVAYGATPSGPIVQSATAHASYPPSALYDGQTSPVCKWASLGGVYYFDVGLNVIPDGDAEQATVPSAWIVGGGTLTRSTAVTPYKGTYHFALTPPGSGDAFGYVDVTASAGAYLQFRCAARATASRRASVRISDRERSMYLTPAGVWTPTPTNILDQTAAAWAPATVTEFRVPTYAEWGRTTGQLRVHLDNVDLGAAGAAYFDEILLYPSGLDVAAFVGHNFPPTSRLQIQSFGDYWHGGQAADIWNDATGRFLQPTGFKLDVATTITHPFIRVSVSLPNGGTALRYPQIAELYLGRTVSLPRSVRPDWPIDLSDEQPRSRTRGGLWAQPDLAYPRRKFPILLDLATAEDATLWNVVRDEMAIATQMGAVPCLLLPATTGEPDACYFGHFRESMSPTNRVVLRELAWEFEELPVPIVA